MSSPTLSFNPDASRSLVDEIVERSNQKINECYQCRRCAAGCTVGEETGITPDRVIRHIITGNREAAISNNLVWQCVSCYTCGTRCPNNIQCGRVTETLKKMSKEEKYEILNPNIAYFHDSFVQGCTRWGRVNEMEFMGFYELKNIGKNLINFKFKTSWDEIANQAKLGFSMFKQKRLHLKLHTSTGRKEIKKFYKTAMKKKKAVIKEKQHKNII